MKKYIPVLVCILTFYGCTKATKAPEPSSQMFQGLNATESSLSGTWYLEKQAYFQGTNWITFTGYHYPDYYITFRRGQLAPKGPYDEITCKNFIGTWGPGVFIAPDNIMPKAVYGGVAPYLDPAGAPRYDSSKRSDFWYFDNATSYLHIGGAKSFIILAGDVMTVTWTNGAETIESTLHR